MSAPPDPALRPVAVVHAGAGTRSPELEQRPMEYRAALVVSLGRARAILERGGDAVDAAQAAVMFMEDEVDFFNAGRGSALCRDGAIEMSAALMRGSDRAAGAVAGVTRIRHPIVAARAVLERSPHVLLVGHAADEYAAAAGAEQRDTSYFVTERQQRRLQDEPSSFDHGTVGAVCIDAREGLAAATSTGGRRGQLSGRVGDSPLLGAGTWADESVAISCTGDGEAFIRTGAARQLASLVASGIPLATAAEQVIRDVSELGGSGGLIALDAHGHYAMPFDAEVMARGAWAAGAEPAVWL